MNKTTIPLLLTWCFALTSCASQDFHQYTGVQQNWPTASGTFVSTKYDVPAYYGPPNRPYIVLGSLDATTVRGIGQDAESAVQDAARVAKRMGADGIIVIVGPRTGRNEFIWNRVYQQQLYRRRLWDRTWQ